MKRSKLFMVLAALAVGGFTTQETPGQPAEERKAQDALPQSKDPLWKVLGKTVIHLDKKEWRYSAEFPAEVKALVGKEVTLNGFVLPVEAGESFTHFILSRRTPTCAFCPPGEANEIVDVWLEKPMKWDADMVTVTGIFELINNDELGMFFKLGMAVRKK